jgi:hypothetical protein
VRGEVMKNLEKTITCTLSSQGHDVFVGAIFLKVLAEKLLVVRNTIFTIEKML